MERSIQLRSEERAIGGCAGIMRLGVVSWCSVPSAPLFDFVPWSIRVKLFQIALKQKTVSGDEEHLGPNQPLRAILLSVAAFAAVVSRAFISLPRHNSTMRNAIRQLRKQAVLRQEGLANLLGVSRQTIIAIENDKYTLHA